jgi:hypothetical protein
MRGRAHCDPYEAFKECKFLGIGINYLNDKLQIFLNEEYLKRDEDKQPIFDDTRNTIKDMSKVLTEHRRRFYLTKRDENKYRGVVLKTLMDQLISNFMLANCKNPFSDMLLRFTIKARNQCLVTTFIRHLIFRQDNGICTLCNRDRMDTIYHILNACPNLLDTIQKDIIELLTLFQKPLELIEMLSEEAFMKILVLKLKKIFANLVT